MKHDQEAFIIRGNTPLRGELTVSSAKNSALYLLLASLLTDEPVELLDVPDLSDVRVTLEILGHFGVRSERHGPHLRLHAAEITSHAAPFGLVSRMRASFVAMGALLGRTGRAQLSMPGGCAFGPRPVDRHINAFKALGVEISEEGGDFHAAVHAPLSGTVEFEAPTVGGTQNVILASAVGSGTVLIKNAALEPEIADLADMLNSMGADISGAETGTITIRGVPRLSGTSFRPLPDRIEAGTYMLAAGATRGSITLHRVRREHLSAVITKLEETGIRVLDAGPDSLKVDATGELRAADVTSAEYPAIPTDLQAPFSAYLATLPGASVVRDRVYPDRFTHVAELRRAGADAEVFERTLIIRGGPLAAARLHAEDIRAGGAVVIAALAASGTSVVTGLEFIDRGYENMAQRLSGLGASVNREKAPGSSEAPMVSSLSGAVARGGD
ncbi:MAG TPA: UDP-N-acetylglucosamine 1-carboxyvinyltransferase [Deinococcales bacterium]|nr:UDP-N-acetylglucosamine 1-carboxyvinyltransferase [Deinococcales bacterium]